ncbi:hypothetical protein DAPPUDRAFT_126480 [Daphnia pulex]|uniref:Uncharacterized protein n=1 Tax=Daphnia pulex TaxID=6669 RepID=E9I815_DAPPU|nr:hypothetical protein DAPPUDRAFT_126480 [Daphnia pulex]|eukprot:EFX59865.1 hypothetical protein DAPPUDRAFT_126480 [Daphnia pulex]
MAAMLSFPESPVAVNQLVSTSAWVIARQSGVVNMMKLRPNHWRYRYAAKVSGFLPLLSILFVAAMISSVIIRMPELFFVAIVLSWPFVLPMAGLGCHLCNYNIFLPYRGLEYPEHGDSWTHPEVEGRSWRKRFVVPKNCPKCGAAILAEGPS